MQENDNIPDALEQMFGSTIELTVMMVIALFSTAVAYLYKVKEGKAFKISSFFINLAVALLMAFFIDMIITYAVADINVKLRMASMVIVGITGDKLMELVEKKGVNWLFSKLFNLPIKK